jgi:hypothetical protein
VKRSETLCRTCMVKCPSPSPPCRLRVAVLIMAQWRLTPLSPEWRRALDVLANASEHGGATEAVMLARGFTVEMVASFVLSGLAGTSVETLKVRGRRIEVVRMKITDAGRFALNNN